MADHLEIATRIETILKTEYLLPASDVREIHIPAAIIGYLPLSLESGPSGLVLRELYDGLSASCTGYRIEQLADYFCVAPRPWKDLWRLADDDRENAIVKKLEQAAERSARLALLRQKLSDDFLGVDAYYEAECESFLNRDNFETFKSDYVGSWLKENLQGGAELDEDQVRAVASVSCDTLVSARAGSGKTSTVIARAFFLCRHCGVGPSEILILAFNRNAAAEVMARFKSLSGADKAAKPHGSATEGNGTVLPHAMTFHALAYALVNPTEDLLANSKDGSDETLNRFLQSIIDDRLGTDDHAREIRDLMIQHFRSDWERIEGGGYLLSADELVQYRRALPRETLAGEYVKSYGEKVIADTLMEHDVAYKYERNFRWSGKNYKPDFTIMRGASAGGVVVEYFGLQGDPDYDEMSVEKRKFWLERPEWDFLEYSPRSLMRDGIESFKERLISEISGCGVLCRRLSDAEIWGKIKDRAVDRFTRAVSSFISRARKSKLLPRDIEERARNISFISEAEEPFVKQAIQIYAEYLDRLAQTAADDFDGLLIRATEGIADGRFRFQRKETGTCDISRLRFIFVDEFQDFSALFLDLLQGIRSVSEANLFCVGDDWQAINGFAGSDIRFFRGFSEIFPGSKRLSITTNYRSSIRVVEIGNALMDGLGDRARPRRDAPQGAILLADLAKFQPVMAEQNRFQGDDISPAVARITADVRRRGGSLTALARKNSLPWYVTTPEMPGVRTSTGLTKLVWNVRGCMSRHDHGRFRVTTVHSFKGLQDESTLILDATAGCYPFVHPDWVFSRVLGITLDDVVDEERRVLYVALTRAKNQLYIVTDPRDPSPLLVAALGRVSHQSLMWEKLQPSTVGTAATHLLVRLSNVPGAQVIGPTGSRDQPLYLARERLKDSGYRFRKVGQPLWEKVISLDGFQLRSILEEPWADSPEGIRLQVLDQSEQVVLLSIDLGSGGWAGDDSKLQDYLKQVSKLAREEAEAPE